MRLRRKEKAEAPPAAEPSAGERWPALETMPLAIRARIDLLHDEGARVSLPELPALLDAFLDLPREGLRQVRKAATEAPHWEQERSQKSRRKLARGIHTADKAAKLVAAPVDGKPAPTRAKKVEPFVREQKARLAELIETRSCLLAGRAPGELAPTEWARFEAIEAQLSEAHDQLEERRAVQAHLAEVPRNGFFAKGSLVVKASAALAHPPLVALVHDRGIDVRARDRHTGKRAVYAINSTGLGLPIVGIGRNRSKDPTRCGWDINGSLPFFAIGRDAQHGMKASTFVPGLFSVMVTAQGELSASMLWKVHGPVRAGGSFFIGHPVIGHVVGPPLDALEATGKGVAKGWRTLTER